MAFTKSQVPRKAEALLAQQVARSVNRSIAGLEAGGNSWSSNLFFFEMNMNKLKNKISEKTTMPQNQILENYDPGNQELVGYDLPFGPKMSCHVTVRSLESSCSEDLRDLSGILSQKHLGWCWYPEFMKGLFWLRDQNQMIQIVAIPNDVAFLKIPVALWVSHDIPRWWHVTGTWSIDHQWFLQLTVICS